MSDKLDQVFQRQEEFMELLWVKGKLSKWPVDLSTKDGQRIVKETLYFLIEELMEASFTLKNKVHRLTDDTKIDIAHYREELGDAFAFFLEVCLFSGITSDDLFDEYCRKNQVVKERLRNGY